MGGLKGSDIGTGSCSLEELPGCALPTVGVCCEAAEAALFCTPRGPTGVVGGGGGTGGGGTGGGGTGGGGTGGGGIDGGCAVATAPPAPPAPLATTAVASPPPLPAAPAARAAAACAGGRFLCRTREHHTQTPVRQRDDWRIERWRVRMEGEAWKIERWRVRIWRVRIWRVRIWRVRRSQKGREVSMGGRASWGKGAPAYARWACDRSVGRRCRDAGSANGYAPDAAVGGTFWWPARTGRSTCRSPPPYS